MQREVECILKTRIKGSSSCYQARFNKSFHMQVKWLFGASQRNATVVSPLVAASRGGIRTRSPGSFGFHARISTPTPPTWLRNITWWQLELMVESFAGTFKRRSHQCSLWSRWECKFNLCIYALFFEERNTRSSSLGPKLLAGTHCATFKSIMSPAITTNHAFSRLFFLKGNANCIWRAYYSCTLTWLKHFVVFLGMRTQ